MKTFALIGMAAAVCFASAAVAGPPVTGRIPLFLAESSGAQSGSSMGAGQKGTAENRESGAAVRSSGGAQASGRVQTEGSSRTSISERSKSSSKSTGVSVRGGHRTVVGASSVSSDDGVVIKRKKARRYVYNEPSGIVIKKKKRVHVSTYDEPSGIRIKKRRAGGAGGR